MKFLTLLFLLGLAGCVTPTPPPLTPFERCMKVVTPGMIYTSDRLNAAKWCQANGNGGIQ